VMAKITTIAPSTLRIGKIERAKAVMAVSIHGGASARRSHRPVNRVR
jgi:hypothetical protein